MAAYAPVNFQSTLTGAMQLVNAALQTACCQGLYGTAATRANGFAPGTVAQQLFGNGNAAVTVGGSLLTSTFVSAGPVAPVALTLGTPSPLVNVAVFINTSQLVNDTWDTAITLLHELGHVYNDVPSSGGSQISRGLSDFNGANDNLIVQDCLINKPTQ